MDTGSQSALIRRGLIREKFRYKSTEPKAFYMADDATKLSGGDYQANAMCVMAGKKKGGGGGWEVIQFGVIPYQAEISYDLVLGHPELWNLAVGFAPRMEKGKLFTHAPQPEYYLIDFDASLVSDPITLKKLPRGHKVCPPELGNVPTLVADERLYFEEQEEAHEEGSAHEVDEAGSEKDAPQIRGGIAPRWRAPKPKPQNYEPIAQEPSRPTRRSQARPDFCQAGIPLPKRAIRPIEMVDRLGRGTLPTYVAMRQISSATKAAPCCKNEHWGLTREQFEVAVRTARVRPDFDVFDRSLSLAKAPLGFLPSQDAFKEPWSGRGVLWICGPYEQMGRIVKKMKEEPVRALVVAPAWEWKPWWAELCAVTLNMWEFPDPSTGTRLYQDDEGRQVPQRAWKSVLCLVDTLNVTMDQGKRTRDTLTIRMLRAVEMEETHELREAIWEIKHQEAKRTQVRSVIGAEGEYRDPEALKLKNKLLEEYGKDVLSGDVSLGVGLPSDFRGPYGEAHIQLAKDHKPKWQKPFHLTGEREEVMKALVDDLIQEHFIEECHSGLWANNAFPVPKPGSKAKIPWRLVDDYRYLNEQTVLDEHPLPLIEKVIQDQGLNRIFTIIDPNQGFHQKPLAPESRPCTAFWVGRKRYQWKVMPMGIKNAGAFFQQMMDEILGDLEGIHCYIDDMLVGSRGKSDKEMFTKHYNDVRRVLEQLRKFKIIAETSKVDFFTRSVQFCGHILEGGTRKPAPGRLMAVERWEKPTNIRGLRGFLGLCNFYSHYVKDYAKIAGPLMDCLKEISKDKNRSSRVRVRWTLEADKSFGELKKAILTVVPLQIIDYSKSFHMDTDASKYAVGAVLQQVGEDGNRRPIAFHSRKLTGSQINWSTREKECYAIISALEKWGSYIGRARVDVRTDHLTLKAWNHENIRSAQGPSP